MALSKEDEESLRRMDEAEQEAQQKEEKFIKYTYPAMSLNEKIGYWSGIIHRNMRWQGESTGDEYAGMFTREWYEACLKFDPQFDQIFRDVISILKLDESKVKIR